MKEALELYTYWYASFSDQHLTQIIRDILQQEYWDNWVIIIYDYLLYWIHYVIDRDKVEPDSKWQIYLMWWAKNNPDKVKEVITDDDRFISYFLENYD